METGLPKLALVQITQIGVIANERNCSRRRPDQDTEPVARTVYLPNGTRLEAHSGLGNRLDLIAIVDVNGLGQSEATPYHHDTGVFARRFAAMIDREARDILAEKFGYVLSMTGEDRFIVRAGP